MKRLFIMFLTIIFISGCSNQKKLDVVDKFVDKVNQSKSYKLAGKMELLNDEETFNYNLDVSYLKGNYYKVEMINQTNDHKQVILKNQEGLYVVTPSLNKSYKFESNWPNNSSQAYVLESLVRDVKNDDKHEVIEDENNYIIKTKVDYPNNDDLKYQKIYLDKKMIVRKVEVYGEADLPKIKVVFEDVDMNAGLKDKDFELSNYITDEKCEEETCKTEETISKIENAIYPLYMPSNTYLSSSEVVNNEQDSRVILTFSGDKNFVIVEESALSFDEHEIIPVYGEPIMLEDTLAALSSNSMYWTSNNVDYYIVSEDLSVMEMVYIASSLGDGQATMGTK